MQQQHDRRICRTGFAVEDVHSIDLGRAMMSDGKDASCHRNFSLPTLIFDFRTVGATDVAVRYVR